MNDSGQVSDRRRPGLLGLIHGRARSPRRSDRRRRCGGSTHVRALESPADGRPHLCRHRGAYRTRASAPARTNRRSSSAGLASTTSRTSTSSCRATSSSSSPGCPAPASRASRSTRSTPRVSAATSSRSARTPASSSGRWTSPTSTSSRGCRRRSRSTRSRRAATRGRRSARSPRSTTTCACCTPASASSTARTTAPGCSARRRSRSSTASSTCDDGLRFQVLAPVVRGRKGEYDTLLEDLSGQGYVRARIDGETVDIDEFLKRDERLAKYENHKIEIVVDRLVLKRRHRAAPHRLARDGARPRRRRRRDRGRAARGRDAGRDAHVQPAPGVSGVRHELRRAGAAQLLVQLAVRRVRERATGSARRSRSTPS